MRELNRSALSPGISIAEVASSFLVNEGLVPRASAGSSFLAELQRNTLRHLKLTFTALVLAIGVGVGIAVSVHRHRELASGFLYITGLIQTIPSIALLALLIPLVGVGQTPALSISSIARRASVKASGPRSVVSIWPVIARPCE